eukprot:ANDGO_08403.mRNA.1 Riboflavin biosynthesis protein RibBA
MDSPTASPKSPGPFTPDYSLLNPSGIDLVNPSPEVLKQRPMHGTTIFLSAADLPTRVGTFRMLVFQDVTTNAYTMAVVSGRGDIRNSKRLYTRAHSSCISSETLHGVDCDCVQQLHGALERIAKSDCGGILWYLLQEGRAAGYNIKARGIQLTQFTHERINTFQAYACMGVKPDYRDYRSIGDACKLMGLRTDVDWVLLSNNPDKIQGLTSIGFKITEIVNLEFTPGPFNAAYLKSKAMSGHHLLLTKVKLPRFAAQLPQSIYPIAPFEPHVVPNAQRFIYMASYLLPMRPVSNRVVLSQAEYDALQSELGPNVEHEWIRGGRHLIRVPEGQEIPGPLRMKPNWFRIHVYRDIVLNTEFVLLQYECAEVDPLGLPVVRLQSESLWNRFPLDKNDPSVRPRKIFRRSIEAIVRHGAGFLLLYPHDGRGVGFGSLAASYMMQNHAAINANVTSEQAEAEIFKLLGVSEGRDYADRDATVQLLLHRGVKSCQLISHSDLARDSWSSALDKAGIRVHRILNVEDSADPKGHHLLLHRTMDSERILKSMLASYGIDQRLNMAKPLNKSACARFVLTGTGESKAHALYLQFLIRKYVLHGKKVLADVVPYSAIPELQVDKESTTLVVFSQGLSPHSAMALKPEIRSRFAQTIVVTAARNAELESAADVTIVRIPAADESGIFIRTIGPLCGYVAALQIVFSAFDDEKIDKDLPRIFDLPEQQQKIFKAVQEAYRLLPDNAWTSVVASKARPVHVLAGHPWPVAGFNLSLKFSEGIFAHQPISTDFLEFPHGPLQQDFSDPKAYLLLFGPEDQSMVGDVEKLVPKGSPVWKAPSSLALPFRIFEWEAMLNMWILSAIQVADVDQRNWPGKSQNP